MAHGLVLATDLFSLAYAVWVLLIKVDDLVIVAPCSIRHQLSGTEGSVHVYVQVYLYVCVYINITRGHFLKWFLKT